jgi:CheY-like chemotaxis protein
LVENGFEVVMTTNSKEGIELAKREMPDVILLDILMPEMNGFDVAKILKSDDTMKNIPILM